MASAFGHAFAAFTITRVAAPAAPHKLLGFAALSAILPDADSIAFKLGIPYAHPLGHRGFTHSILFAEIWALALAILVFRKDGYPVRAFLVILLATLSHGLLDAMTNGGLGVGFFIPFENSRYFLDWRPIAVSPISVARFFEQGLPILWNEAIYIGLPCLALLALAKLIRVARARAGAMVALASSLLFAGAAHAAGTGFEGAPAWLEPLHRMSMSLFVILGVALVPVLRFRFKLRWPYVLGIALTMAGMQFLVLIISLGAIGGMTARLDPAEFLQATAATQFLFAFLHSLIAVRLATRFSRS